MFIYIYTRVHVHQPQQSQLDFWPPTEHQIKDKKFESKSNLSLKLNFS